MSFLNAVNGRLRTVSVCCVSLLSAALMSACSPATGGASTWFTPVEEPEPLALLSLDAEADGGDWELGPDLGLVHDEELGREVWEHSGGRRGWMRADGPFPPSFVLKAKVRVMEDGHGATLCAGEGHDEWELSLTPLRLRGAPLMRVSTSRSRRDHYLEDASLSDSAARDSLAPALPPIPNRVDFGYRFTEAPSPLSDGVYRREIEAALTAQAARGEYTGRWHTLRIESRPGRLRMYVNGVPVGESSAVSAVSGGAVLRLDRSVRIAGLELKSSGGEVRPYYPVDITRRLNARSAETDAALSGPDGRGEVEDIPFVFSRDASGNDHIDIGESLFRERSRFRHGGRVTRFIWPHPIREFDPGRIMFSVPNHAYSRLWVVAAFDGDEDMSPVLTARFFKPGRGFPVDSAVEIPGARARSAAGEAVRLPVDAEDDTGRSLWLVPIDLDAGRLASEMRDLDRPGGAGQGAGDGRDGSSFWLQMELTKEVHPFRTYPDPHNYGWFQGGLRSGVRVYGMTFEKAPVHMVASGNRHGNIYVSPENPLWLVDLNNQLAEPVGGVVRLSLIDPYGEAAGECEAPFGLPALGATRLEIPFEPGLYGLYTVDTAVEVDGHAGSEPVSRMGTFVQLPHCERQTGMKDSPWGAAGNAGGRHTTHDVLEDNFYILRALGGRRGIADVDADSAELWGIQPRVQHVGPRSPRAWAFEYPYDEGKYAETSEEFGTTVASRLEENPLIAGFCGVSIESRITRSLTSYVPRRYTGEDPTWAEEEERAVRGHMVFGRAAFEGIREHAPDARIGLGWATSNYTPPLLKSGFPRELFDFIGVDDPVFELTPEMPIRQQSLYRIWLLRQALEDYGYEDVPIRHVESYYPTSNPLALGWRRSADHWTRMLLLSRSVIPNMTFGRVLGIQDLASYYGSQHYGEHGALTREPEANPKPAAPEFATMTRLLDPGEYQRWVDTGSLSAYCLHYTCRAGHIYPMWTLRGERRAYLHLPEGAGAVKVDGQGNEFELERDGEGRVSVSLTPTPLWVVSDEPVGAVTLGRTDHSYVATQHPLMDAQTADGSGGRYRPEDQVGPGEHSVVLDVLETPWSYVPGTYEPHAENHWGTPRYAGPMRSEPVHCDELDARVWEIELQEPDVKRELAAWYGVFEPQEPIEIPGRARALGVWADGRSNWGRIVYELEDAGGEVWRSTGTKDDWNCDDIHTWSFFNYDGWRYLEFPLPAHLPYDNYRLKDTVWWGSDEGEGQDRVVQLPLRLKRIIIEHRTHNVHVDELVEVSDRSVRLHNLKAVYSEEELKSEAPVRRQRRLEGRLREDRDVELPPLPNPIQELRERGEGEGPEFLSLSPPDEYDGVVTRLEIELSSVDGAELYRIYVSAYEDGRGAVQVAEGSERVQEVSRLEPGVPLYLFAVSVDSDGRESEPSEAERILLIDDFEFR